MGSAAELPGRGGIRLIQLEHRMWLEHNFPAQTREQIMLGMTEELGELAHHLLKREQGIRGGEDVDHDAEIKDACADLVIFMMGLADLEGFILHDAIADTWAVVKQRDWVAHPKNGVDE